MYNRLHIYIHWKGSHLPFHPTVCIFLSIYGNEHLNKDINLWTIFFLFLWFRFVSTTKFMNIIFKLNEMDLIIECSLNDDVFDSFTVVVYFWVSLRFQFYERKKEQNIKKYAFRFLGKRSSEFFLFVYLLYDQRKEHTKKTP